VADEPVVVSKARPMKASNGVEDKTKPTFANVCKGANHCQKHGELRRGEVIYKSLKSSGIYIGSTSCRIRQGLLDWLRLKPRLIMELGMGSNYFSLLEAK